MRDCFIMSSFRHEEMLTFRLVISQSFVFFSLVTSLIAYPLPPEMNEHSSPSGSFSTAGSYKCQNCAAGSYASGWAEECKLNDGGILCFHSDHIPSKCTIFPLNSHLRILLFFLSDYIFLVLCARLIYYLLFFSSLFSCIILAHRPPFRSRGQPHARFALPAASLPVVLQPVRFAQGASTNLQIAFFAATVSLVSSALVVERRWLCVRQAAFPPPVLRTAQHAKEGPFPTLEHQSVSPAPPSPDGCRALALVVPHKQTTFYQLSDNFVRAVQPMQAACKVARNIAQQLP
jgi:hypothetical protein